MSVLTATTFAPTSAARSSVSSRALLRINLVATVLAGAVTEALIAVVRAAGVHLAVGNPGGDASSVVPITTGACAVSIAMSMVLGTTIALLVNRRAARPAHTYRVVTGLLVAVSFVPPLSAGATAASTKVTLIAAHILAAAIIVPLVSRRLPRAR